ncbi:hypothetical protein QE152_g38554 [Popillia japonica]|uniref:Uncharacterized protein n=1 Tax=Popillia japonica TaxID=7064 RepID=A0AAW1HWQ1_POPJA
MGVAVQGAYQYGMVLIVDQYRNECKSVIGDGCGCSGSISIRDGPDCGSIPERSRCGSGDSSGTISIRDGPGCGSGVAGVVTVQGPYRYGMVLVAEVVTVQGTYRYGMVLATDQCAVQGTD